jgi:hypothetical protein
VPVASPPPTEDAERSAERVVSLDTAAAAAAVAVDTAFVAEFVAAGPFGVVLGA